MNFFRKIKKSVFKFEEYQTFAREETISALKYFLLMILIFTIITLIASLYPMINRIKDGVEYMRENIPDFSIKDGILAIDAEEPIYIENNEMSLIICINTNASSEDANTFFDENQKYNNVILLSESNLYGKLEFFVGTMSENYKTITDTISIGEISKQSIINYWDDSGYFKLYTSFFLTAFLSYFAINIVVVLLDVLILMLVGMIATKLYKINLSYKNCFNLAVYSLTLPIILKIIYSLVNSFTGFSIQYFDFMYRMISYIYIVTAILMMREDTNKNASDLIKIEEEIKKEEKEELPIKEPEREKEKESKDKKKEKKKENEKNKGTPEPNPGKA